MSIDIGSRLRYVRLRSDISQRELAKRVGVTNSTISLIESNQTNPSVGALKRSLSVMRWLFRPHNFHVTATAIAVLLQLECEA